MRYPKIYHLPLVFAVVAAPAVHAEDFTGFYAGVNAGYGWSREEAKGPAPSVSPGTDPGAGSSASTLPPSASAAASTLGRTNRNRANR